MLHTCRFCDCSSVWKSNIITLAADNTLAFSSAPATQKFPISLTTVVLSPDVFHFSQCLVNSCRIGCEAGQLWHHHIPINIFTGPGSLLDTLQYCREWSVYPAKQKLHISTAEQKKLIPEGKKNKSFPLFNLGNGGKKSQDRTLVSSIWPRDPYKAAKIQRCMTCQNNTKARIMPAVMRFWCTPLFTKMTRWV